MGTQPQRSEFPIGRRPTQEIKSRLVGRRPRKISDRSMIYIGFFINLGGLKAQLPASSFEIVGDLRIHAKNIGGYELDMFLDNAYAVYTSGNRDLDAVFSDQIESVKRQQKVYGGPDVKSIFPVIKPVDYFEVVKKQLKQAGYNSEELPMYYQKLNDDLYEVYVFNSTENMRLVTPDDVKKLEIENTISSVAAQNIARHYKEAGASISEIDTNGNGHIFRFKADENYEASLILASDYLKDLQVNSKGPIVVFIPARNIALITDSGDVQATQLAAGISARVYSEMGYAISPYGYIKKDGEWVRYTP
ncbi:DUF1444 family protein [Pokkaliibacter sp. MBI-7]|uniref:DUF1444 family protein n=1 Tax=Pokkaliibacter sp. MBI-7 TaxID=3040600 RepID=UPI00244D689E|nr:DUF1444 family protein [Pokkaliibacter sp. MBI-7]MDH2434417.1 DUF1444 family protein [Pokkaliibacter sp. MBI-7]